MPRIPRGETIGGIYHVINRGNMRMQVFDDSDDYEYFIELLELASKKENIEIHAYSLMPNHFHLLLVPKEEKSMSKFMQWVMTSHVRYYHAKNRTSGHIWQGRYKSFIVQKDSYYITLIQYIESNPLRANLVKTAQEWKYSSLQERLSGRKKLLSDTYVELDKDWGKLVNTPIKEIKLKNIRNSVNRQAPLGEENWQIKIATKYDMLSTLNSRGRPKVKKK